MTRAFKLVMLTSAFAFFCTAAFAHTVTSSLTFNASAQGNSHKLNGDGVFTPGSELLVQDCGPASGRTVILLVDGTPYTGGLNPGSLTTTAGGAYNFRTDAFTPGNYDFQTRVQGQVGGGYDEVPCADAESPTVNVDL